MPTVELPKPKNGTRYDFDASCAFAMLLGMAKAHCSLRFLDGVGINGIDSNLFSAESHGWRRNHKPSHQCHSRSGSRLFCLTKTPKDLRLAIFLIYS